MDSERMSRTAILFHLEIDKNSLIGCIAGFCETFDIIFRKFYQKLFQMKIARIEINQQSSLDNVQFKFPFPQPNFNYISY